MTIIADKNNDGSLAFTPSSVTADTGSCLGVTFQNNAKDLKHDFSIDKGSGGMAKGVSIDIANASMPAQTFNLQMPSKAGTITFYCDQPGHRAAGMVGTITVSNPNSKSPGFTGLEAILGLAAIMVAVPVVRKHKKLD